MSKIRPTAPRRTETIRGNDKLIITPDTCSLINAGVKIPDDFFVQNPREKGYLPPEERPKRFHEIYTQHLPHDKILGLHVLDVIGGELFGRAADGSYYDREFSNGDFGNHSDLKTFAKVLYDHSNSFVKVVETPAGRAFLQALSRLADLRRSLAAYFAEAGDDESVHTQKATIAALVKRISKTLKTDRGETMVKAFLLEHPNPTLFISDDEGARNDVINAAKDNKNGCIYVDNTFGFLEKLMGTSEQGKAYNPEKNLLHTKCGFQPWVTPEMIVLEMHRGQKKKDSPSTSPAAHKMKPSYTEIVGKSRASGTPKPLEEWLR